MKLIALALLAVVAFCQEAPKKAPKPFKMPEIPSEWMRIKDATVYILHDEDCAKDFLRIQRLTGVELRKALKELVDLKCAQLADPRINYKAYERVEITSGESKAVFRHVSEFDIGLPYTHEFSWIRESDLVVYPKADPKSPAKQ